MQTDAFFCQEIDIFCIPDFDLSQHKESLLKGKLNFVVSKSDKSSPQNNRMENLPGKLQMAQSVCYERIPYDHLTI